MSTENGGGGGSFFETESSKLSEEDQSQNELVEMWQPGSSKIVQDNLDALRECTGRQFMILYQDGAEEKIKDFGMDIRKSKRTGAMNEKEVFKLLTASDTVGCDAVQKCFRFLGLELNSPSQIKDFLAKYFIKNSQKELGNNINQRLVIVWILLYLFYDFVERENSKASSSSTSSSSRDSQASSGSGSDMLDLLQSIKKAQEAAALESRRAIANLERRFNDRFNDLERRVKAPDGGVPPSSTPSAVAAVNGGNSAKVQVSVAADSSASSARVGGGTAGEGTQKSKSGGKSTKAAARTKAPDSGTSSHASLSTSPDPGLESLFGNLNLLTTNRGGISATNSYGVLADEDEDMESAEEEQLDNQIFDEVEETGSVVADTLEKPYESRATKENKESHARRKIVLLHKYRSGAEHSISEFAKLAHSEGVIWQSLSGVVVRIVRTNLTTKGPEPEMKTVVLNGPPERSDPSCVYENDVPKHMFPFSRLQLVLYWRNRHMEARKAGLDPKGVSWGDAVDSFERNVDGILCALMGPLTTATDSSSLKNHLSTFAIMAFFLFVSWNRAVVNNDASILTYTNLNSWYERNLSQHLRYVREATASSMVQPFNIKLACQILFVICEETNCKTLGGHTKCFQCLMRSGAKGGGEGNPSSVPGFQKAIDDWRLLAPAVNKSQADFIKQNPKYAVKKEKSITTHAEYWEHFATHQELYRPAQPIAEDGSFA